MGDREGVVMIGYRWGVSAIGFAVLERYVNYSAFLRVAMSVSGGLVGRILVDLG